MKVKVSVYLVSNPKNAEQTNDLNKQDLIQVQISKDLKTDKLAYKTLY